MFKKIKNIAIICSIFILASCAQNVDTQVETNQETGNEVSLTVKVPTQNEIHPISYNSHLSGIKIALPSNIGVYSNEIKPGSSKLISNKFTPGEYKLYAYFNDGDYFYSCIKTINLNSPENLITLEAKDFTKSSFNFSQFGDIKKIVNHGQYKIWDESSSSFITGTIIIYNNFNSDFIAKLKLLEPNNHEYFDQFRGYIDTDSIIQIYTWRDEKDLSVKKAELKILSPDFMNKNTSDKYESFNVVMNKKQYEDFMNSTLLNQNIEFITNKDSEYKKANNFDEKFKALGLNNTEVIVKNHQGFTLFEDDKNSSQSVYTRQYIYNNGLNEKITSQLNGLTANTRFNFKDCYDDKEAIIELQEILDDTSKAPVRYNMIIYTPGINCYENGSGYKISDLSKDELNTFLTSPDFKLPTLESSKHVNVTIPNKSFFSIPSEVKVENSTIFMEIRRVKDNYVSYYKEDLSFDSVIKDIPLDEENYTVQLFGICENYCFASVCNFNAGTTNNVQLDSSLTKCEKIDIEKRMNSIGKIESISKPVFDKHLSTDGYYYFTNEYIFTSLNENFKDTVSYLDAIGFNEGEQIVWNKPKIKVGYSISKENITISAASLECYPSSSNSNQYFNMSSQNIERLDTLTINLDQSIKLVQNIRQWLKDNVNSKLKAIGTNCTIIDYPYPVLLTGYWKYDYYQIIYVYDSLNETLTNNLLNKKSNCGFNFNSNDYIANKKSFIQLELCVNKETDKANKIEEYEFRFYTPGIAFGEYGPGVSISFYNEEDFMKFITSNDYPLNTR